MRTETETETLAGAGIARIRAAYAAADAAQDAAKRAQTATQTDTGATDALALTVYAAALRDAAQAAHRDAANVTDAVARACATPATPVTSAKITPSVTPAEIIVAAVESPTAPAGALGITAELHQAMPRLDYRLYVWAKSKAVNETFTCVRQDAAAALDVSPRRIGYAVTRHLAAGVWTVHRKGTWGIRGRRPARTLYRVARAFDLGQALGVYLAAKASMAGRIAGVRGTAAAREAE